MATSASPSSELVSPVHPLPTAPSNPNSSVSSSITIQNIGSMVPIKLTTTNYLTWSALFAPIFRRYNLTGLIDGSMAAPPQFTLNSSGNRILNPAYTSWYENDQNILIWINSTLSESLIPYTVGVNSARELWAKLESRLATASQSHIHELRSRLRNITKGESTAAHYLQQIEAIADALASAGSPIDDSDLISVTLHGLPPEYDSFVDAIQFHLGSTTIDELHGLLLSKEIQLANRHLVETARTLLVASKVPHIYWVEAFATAVYLINRLPTVSRSSPWESLFHRPPNYDFLKVFGCACSPWLKPYTSSKLDSKSKAYVFLGYSLNHKGYKCLDIATK